ncbi:MAG: Spy/CpxP family protein refolding chaperone [Kiritimatiellaeota bacterium]|nr:Spy/CpxP family protein refolding chaperone [Kiritimatiellota bacterium]
MQNTLGLTDEQVAKLRPLLAEVDAKIREVDAKIQKLGLDQANVFAKALADKEDESEKELLALTDKIGEASVERARLRIQRLLVLKQVLTPEQVAKAADLVKERAARQVELNKAMAEGDMATVQRLMNEMRQQGGFGPGGFGPGGGAQGGGRGQGGPGGNNNNNGGNRGNRAGGGNNNGGGNRGGGNRGGNNNNNNAGGGNNNANAPAPAGWGN